MIEITREVIIDLLPAYFSDEVSEQTRRIIEDYFDRDPEFAQMAQRMNDKLLQAVPVRLSENHEMTTLRRTQNTVKWRIIGLAVTLTFVLAMLAFIAAAFLMVR